MTSVVDDLYKLVDRNEMPPLVFVIPDVAQLLEKWLAGNHMMSKLDRASTAVVLDVVHVPIHTKTCRKEGKAFPKGRKP